MCVDILCVDILCVDSGSVTSCLLCKRCVSSGQLWRCQGWARLHRSTLSECGPQHYTPGTQTQDGTCIYSVSHLFVNMIMNLERTPVATHSHSAWKKNQCIAMHCNVHLVFHCAVRRNGWRKNMSSLGHIKQLGWDWDGSTV